MTMPRVVAISQHAQQRAIQKVADLFTGFSLIFRRPGRWHQATAVGAKRKQQSRDPASAQRRKRPSTGMRSGRRIRPLSVIQLLQREWLFLPLSSHPAGRPAMPELGWVAADFDTRR